ncbi:MAG: FAD-dependent oxidoreductase, partial [Ilumatobacteraceae bacterium]
MTNSRYDAVIIGAGVIGTAVTHELSRRGWRTLTVDKGPAAGFGSTLSAAAAVTGAAPSVCASVTAGGKARAGTALGLGITIGMSTSSGRGLVSKTSGKPT